MAVIDELKEYLNIYSGDTDNDSLLSTLLVVSENVIKNYCRGGLDEVTIDDVPELKFAKIQYAAHLFVNRGIISVGQVTELPYTFKFILNKYIKY